MSVDSGGEGGQDAEELNHWSLMLYCVY
jgi:hypothetical protein